MGISTIRRKQGPASHANIPIRSLQEQKVKTSDTPSSFSKCFTTTIRPIVSLFEIFRLYLSTPLEIWVRNNLFNRQEHRILSRDSGLNGYIITCCCEATITHILKKANVKKQESDALLFVVGDVLIQQTYKYPPSVLILDRRIKLLRCPVCSDKLDINLGLGTAECHNCGWKKTIKR